MNYDDAERSSYKTDYNAAYYLSSTVVHSKYSLQELKDSQKLLGRAERSRVRRPRLRRPRVRRDQDDNMLAEKPRREPVTIESLESIAAGLTWLHELHHYQQSITTTFGLFVWRLMVCMTHDVRWLCTAARRVQGIEPIRKSIKYWASRSRYSNVMPETAQIPDSLRTEFSDPREYCSFLIRQIDDALMNLFLLEYFHKALMGKDRELSMSQFVSAANVVFSYLGHRCGIDSFPTWTTRLRGDAWYLPEGALSGAEIIEGSARMEEFRLLLNVQTTEGVLDEWQRTKLFGVYQPAYWKFADNHLSPQVSQIIVDQALMGALDICCGEGGDVIYVEDVLPSWRLNRLIEGTRNVSWPRTRSELASVIENEVYPRSGLESPKRMLESISSRSLNGPDGWSWQDPSRPNQVRFNLERISDALRQRFDDPFHVVWPTSQFGLLPLLEIYTDGIFSSYMQANMLPNVDVPFTKIPAELNRELYYSAYASLVQDYALLSALDGDGIDGLLSMEAAVLSGMPPEVSQSWTIQHILSTMPDNPLSWFWDEFFKPTKDQSK
jgi:hypothetical protein